MRPSVTDSTLEVLNLRERPNGAEPRASQLTGHSLADATLQSPPKGPGHESLDARPAGSPSCELPSVLSQFVLPATRDMVLWISLYRSQPCKSQLTGPSDVHLTPQNASEVGLSLVSLTLHVLASWSPV